MQRPPSFMGKSKSMPVHDIFSKRAQRSSGQKPDVFVYDEIPNPLRVQIVHLLGDLLGVPEEHNPYIGAQYAGIHQELAREYGLFELSSGKDMRQKLLEFVLKGAAPAQVMDVVELAFARAATFNPVHYQIARCRATVPEAVKEFNFRCLEHGVGYQFENGHIIRVDSTLMHSEVVKPALLLLSDSKYQGAQEEFLSAHKHYREGKHKECIADCLKAFESTMKTICEIKRWPYAKTDTAKTLIDVCVQKGLIDPMLMSHVGALRTVLEAGVPTLRNKLAGHGQGVSPVMVPAHYAAFVLHLTAANIIFLTNSGKP
jgi:hypothetical protein